MKKVRYALVGATDMNPAREAAAKAVRTGRLGAVNDCCFHMEFAYGYDPKEAATWRCSKVEEMGGPIGDVASHCFYMAEFVLGKRIDRVAAAYYPKVMDIKSEDGAYVKFFFEDALRRRPRPRAFIAKRVGLAVNPAIPSVRRDIWRRFLV